MGDDVRQELAGIFDQASEYLQWLKDDGVEQLEITPSKAEPMKKTTPAKAGSTETELRKIAAEVAVCKKCGLHSSRTNTVPGQGSPSPEIMFIGEAPGADEDEQGIPFVGRSGQLLTKMIEAMGIRREDVFIANIAKCRPPDNRKPTPVEMDTCLPYLKRQIAAIRPKVIVALGATAVSGLLNLDGISKLRGTWQIFEGIDVMPTFHPAYLLRNPPMKREAWADLLAVLKRLGRTAPPVKKEA